jgi:hypothetical protein
MKEGTNSRKSMLYLTSSDLLVHQQKKLLMKQTYSLSGSSVNRSLVRQQGPNRRIRLRPLTVVPQVLLWRYPRQVNRIAQNLPYLLYGPENQTLIAARFWHLHRDPLLRKITLRSRHQLLLNLGILNKVRTARKPSIRLEDV